MNDTNTPEIINGPARKTMYVAALYFTMTCMTSVCLNILNVYWRTIQHIITHKWEQQLQFPLQLIIYLECWFFPLYCVALDLYKCFQFDIDKKNIPHKLKHFSNYSWNMFTKSNTQCSFRRRTKNENYLFFRYTPINKTKKRKQEYMANKTQRSHFVYHKFGVFEWMLLFFVRFR